MKTTIVCVSLASALFGTSAAAQTPPQRSITVNGSAEIRVAPDEVILTVGVETHSMNIATAGAENDARVKKIVAAAREHGVAADHVKTEFLSLDPRYRDNYNKTEFLGYFARRSLTITLRDPSKFERLLASVVTSGANYIHGIDFRTTELRKHRDAARENALRAAREKAELMTGALNANLGAPLLIQEGHSGWWSPYSSWWGSRAGGWTVQNVVQSRDSRAAAEGDTLVPGQISVSATVTVTFELNPTR